MNLLKIVFGFILIIIITSCTKEKITLESLLKEMTDRKAITYFPENSYTLKQFSSYDRKTVSPDNSDWWANADYTQFVREENNSGRREFVLFDANGPGAVVRYWMTFAGNGASEGTLRIYIDGNENPVIEGNVLEILSGKLLAEAPLASSVSPETEYQRRGHNLYLPIPYSGHCKITYECDAVQIEENRRKPSIYYNICYRTYDSKVVVESYSKEVLERAEKSITETCNILLEGVTEIVAKTFTEQKKLASKDSLTLAINEKGKAISQIRLKLDAENLSQALRSTVLAIRFDGEETVWLPAGDFFGTGYQVFQSDTWVSKVEENGFMQAKWIMPFKSEATIRVINFGDQDVDVTLEVADSEYKWNKSSMYFGASWHEYNRLNTAKDSSLENHEWHFDVNYTDIKGNGIYAGDALTVFNTADAWWGEGDEKIFVDGESFPSSIGTGTEDYYGYAWCRPEKFTHPFIAQPTGAGNFHPGMTVNMRYRSLDAIPFTSQISSNIEMWHWAKTRVNFAMSAYWYAKPGFEVNIKPNPAIVKIPVALKRTDIFKPVVDESGKIEGEYLDVVYNPSGTVSTQSGDYGWSNGSQLWWRFGEVGDQIIAKFILNQTGKYRVSAQLTKAVDYGMIQLYINNLPVGKTFNGFQPLGVSPVLINLGTIALSSGENILTVKIIGADKKATPGNMAGIDFLQFEKIN